MIRQLGKNDSDERCVLPKAEINTQWQIRGTPIEYNKKNML